MNARAGHSKNNYRSTLALHLVAIALIVVPTPVVPAVIVVDGQTGDAPGTCDLVEAIENANNDDGANVDCVAGTGVDEIQLMVDVVLDASDNGGNLNGTGTPRVGGELTIEGNGHTISRDPGASQQFRILFVQGGGDSAGTLTLKNTTVSGGIVTNPNAESVGGGIVNEGTLTIMNSTITGNTLAPGVGGDYLPWSYGGGIFNRGQLTVQDSAIVGNTIVSSSIVGGESVGAGGAGISNGHYGGTAPNMSLTITGSTISGNTVDLNVPNSFAFVYAGGAYLYSGDIDISNSTISTNSSYAYSLDPIVQGGGLTSSYVTAVLENTTIAMNESIALGPPGAYLDPRGGGLARELSGGMSVELKNTILYGNLPENCFVDVGQDLVDGGNNFATDASCGTIPDTLTNVDPILKNNGGETETHQLLAGSTAIDAAGVCGLATDQRGALRSDGLCDSGAFEFGSCSAPDGTDFVVPDGTTTSETTFEACNSIEVNAQTIMGPNGHLILRSGGSVTFNNGLAVELDGKLTVDIDGSLVMPEIF